MHGEQRPGRGLEVVAVAGQGLGERLGVGLAGVGLVRHGLLHGLQLDDGAELLLQRGQRLGHPRFHDRGRLAGGQFLVEVELLEQEDLALHRAVGGGPALLDVAAPGEEAAGVGLEHLHLRVGVLLRQCHEGLEAAEVGTHGVAGLAMGGHGVQQRRALLAVGAQVGVDGRRLDQPGAGEAGEGLVGERGALGDELARRGDVDLAGDGLLHGQHLGLDADGALHGAVGGVPGGPGHEGQSGVEG